MCFAGYIAWITLFIFILKLMHFVFVATLQRYRINGPPGLPVVGHLHLLKDLLGMFDAWRGTYGDVFQIQLGSWATVVVNGFDAVKEAAERSDDAFSSRPDFITNQVLRSCFDGEDSIGLGPFSDVYLLQRKFTARTLKRYTNSRTGYLEDILILEADNLVHMFLRQHHEPDAMEKGIKFAVGSVIYQLLYGYGENVREDPNFADTLKAAETTGDITKQIPFEFLPWLRYVLPNEFRQYRKLAKKLDTVRVRKLGDHLKTFDKDTERDMLDAFLVVFEDRSGFPTRSGLLGSCTDLLNAGLETTTSAIRWLLLYMMAYPDVQRRVQQEIDDVIGSRHGVRIDDRQRMPYTQATINEVLRIADVFPCGVPRCSNPHKDTALFGHCVAKNSMVLLNLHSVSHDKGIWGDPENFRPQRLLTKDNCLDRAKCSQIIPFGLGTRRCPGENLARTELFVFFTTLLQRCSFSAPPGSEISLVPVPGTVFKPKPFQIRVTQRM